MPLLHYVNQSILVLEKGSTCKKDDCSSCERCLDCFRRNHAFIESLYVEIYRDLAEVLEASKNCASMKQKSTTTNEFDVFDSSDESDSSDKSVSSDDSVKEATGDGQALVKVELTAKDRIAPAATSAQERLTVTACRARRATARKTALGALRLPPPKRAKLAAASRLFTTSKRQSACHRALSLQFSVR